MERFSIINREDADSKAVTLKIKTELINGGLSYDETSPQLVICVGGDGTLLYAVHQYIDLLDKVYFVALHTGTLGFYTDYTRDQIDELIHDILNDHHAYIYSPKLLEVKIKNQTFYALNEIRIENILRTQTFDIYVDGEFFERFKGNGMCLSTQAGSTAYNRSLKGAVIDAGVSLMQLVEIAGIHDHQHRTMGVPYIMRDDRAVKFKGNFANASLCYDYLYTRLDGVDEINCKMSYRKVRFIRYHEYSYLERLRNLY